MSSSVPGENNLDLANALRDERKVAELQRLDKSFYQKVGAYLAGLELELSRIEDPYSVEAQIIQDTLKSDRNSVNKLIDQRMKKVVRKVIKTARSASREESLDSMTTEEELIYQQLLKVLLQGRETILAHLARTERPLTGKKDITQEYEVVRLLDSVPIFMGVNGRRYLLSVDDVVALPAVHAKNLCTKKLAQKVKIKR
jgi:DNA replication factor GINS